MKEFKDKVAVITGAASGIGRALAERCAQEGMKVVLADIEEKALSQTEAEMKAAGAGVLAVLTDVSKPGDLRTLGRKALRTYGAVHLLCNNAGVGAGSTVWESTINDWKWVIGVNVWGVIHGLRVFLPIMLEQDSEGHIVNTASIAGMISYHRSAAYHLSKHAIVALSEKLFHDLAARGSKIRVSVLCPGWVRTGIMDSMRNRPAALRDNAPEIVITPEMKEAMEQYRRACEAGIPPANVADHVFQAVRDEKFYIFTHPEYAPLMKERLEAVLQQRNPTEPARLQALLGQ